MFFYLFDSNYKNEVIPFSVNEADKQYVICQLRNEPFTIERNFYFTKKKYTWDPRRRNRCCHWIYQVMFRHSKTSRPMPLSHYFCCGDTVLTVFMCILTCYQWERGTAYWGKDNLTIKVLITFLLQKLEEPKWEYWQGSNFKSEQNSVKFFNQERKFQKHTFCREEEAEFLESFTIFRVDNCALSLELKNYEVP